MTMTTLMSKTAIASCSLFALVLLGCAYTDYPVITDTRGDYSGVIRTGHKAYIIPSNTVAVIWPDGSDQVFSTVAQNQFGDQTLYAFNNYDPTASVMYLDQTYCDWRYDGCESVRAWNPANPAIDDPYDFEQFPDCSGWRTMELTGWVDSRIGECGDGLMRPDPQHFAEEFANLVVTAWRGGNGYLLPVDASNTTITFTGTNGVAETMPLYGHFNLFFDDQLRMAVPMTPNARHEYRWLAEYAARNGRKATATLQYGSFSTSMKIGLVQENLEYASTRF